MRISFLSATFLALLLGTVFYNSSRLVLGRTGSEYSALDENSLRALSQVERDTLLNRLLSERASSRNGLLSGDTYLNSSTLIHKARLLGLLASMQSDAGAQIKAACEALSVFGRVLQGEPNNSYALINWSNLRQMIARHDCGLELTTADFRAALDAAVEYDRASPQVAYSGALISFWSGDPDRSAGFLNHFLNLSTSLSPGQERFILARLDSPKLVEMIIPARFPQIAIWSKKISEARPQVFDDSRASLFRMQLQAIETNLAEVSQEKISTQLAAERLMSLLPVVSDDSVRRRVDLELSKLIAADQQDEVAEYLMARHSLANLKVVSSVLRSDTRPATGSLSSWNSNDNFSVDEFHNSLGFFLPEDVSVKLIELSGIKGGRSINPDQIGVFVSQDNRNWSEVSSGITRLAFRLDDRPYLTFKVSSSPYRYWKIHFGSAERSRNFAGRPLEMLRVYGLGGAR